MAYIIDLTLVMQNIFFCMEVVGHRPLTRRLIKFALKTYKESAVKEAVHRDINEYVQKAGIFERVGRDKVLEKIEDLINKNRIESAEMRSLRDQVGNIDLSGEDEPWTVGSNNHGST